MNLRKLFYVSGFLAMGLLLIWPVINLFANNEADKGTKGTAEWTQWRGPNRDGISGEKILKQWPESGLKELWRKPIGSGFSAISVANNHFFTMYTDGEDEYTACFNTENGDEIWRTRTDDFFQATEPVRASMHFNVALSKP